MEMNRTYRNLISNLVVQVLLALSGMVIPKLIISVYGSTLNGMVSSIGQFLMYAGLVEAGVGNASIVALYKPLADGSQETVNAILSEAARQYTRSGILYTLIAFIIACIYPLAVQTQVDIAYAFSMTVILALVGVLDYLIIGKYKVLLTADNRYYIINFSKAIATCILSLGSILLLLHGVSLLFVKGLAVVTHLAEAIFIKQYVRIKYKLYSFKSNRVFKLEQQNSALLCRICTVITYNTDLVVLTMVLPGTSLLEISVYSVYSLVLSFVKNIISVCYTGIGATFGELYAKNDMKTLERRFRHYELIYLVILFSIYACFMPLILPFVSCYVGNVTDINYVRTEFAVLFGVIGMASQVKDAYSTLVHSGCGAYKETRKYAVYEAVINLLLSLAFVYNLGVVGVLLGTLISHFFMDYGMIRYARTVILPDTLKYARTRILRNFIVFILLCILEMYFTRNINTWTKWVIMAVFIVVTNFAIFILVNYIFDKDDMNAMLFVGLHKYIKNRKDAK